MKLAVEAKLRLVQCAKVRDKASIRCSPPNCVQVGLQQVRLKRSVPAEGVENLVIDNANVREREEHKLTVPVRIQTPTRPGFFDALDAHYPVWRLRHPTTTTTREMPSHRRGRSRSRERSRSRSRDRSESSERDIQLPNNAKHISESDYFLRSDEFRVWLKDEKRKVRGITPIMLGTAFEEESTYFTVS